MTDTPPRLFDDALLLKRLSRCHFQAEAGFLLRHMAREMAERLSLVKRQFSSACVLAPDGFDVKPFLPTLAVQEGGAQAHLSVLPLEPQSQTLLVSLGLMQVVNDLPGFLVQAARALVPDGFFLGVALGGDSLHELRQSFMAAEAEMDGGASPRVAPFADVRALGGLLQRAGLALPVADSETLIIRYDNAFALMKDLRAMGAANPLVLQRKSLRRSTVMRMADIYAERFADKDGRIRATVELVWLSGWAPHESQQKPLTPGSAAMRLADALKTKG